MRIEVYLVERVLVSNGRQRIPVLLLTTTDKAEARRALATDVELMLSPAKQAALERVGADIQHRMTTTTIMLKHGYE